MAKPPISSVPVLMYHHICPRDTAHSVSPEQFRDHLKGMRQRGVRVLSMDEFCRWREGRLELRQPSVLLTFDDAWLDNWVYALPILQEFQANAVFFVVTSWPGQGAARTELLGWQRWEPKSHKISMELAGTGRGDEVSMRWSEIQAARDTGLVSIGCHSHTHGSWWDGGGSWEEKLKALEEDLQSSRDTMRQNLGETTTHWCWPKGLFSNRALSLAAEYGFTSQFSTLRGSNGFGDTRLVRRIDVENRPASWLLKRVSVYSNPMVGGALGLSHQRLHEIRMSKRFASAFLGEFNFPLFRLI